MAGLLPEARHLLDAFSVSSRENLLIVSPAGHVLTASAAALDFFGLSEEELIGLPLAELERLEGDSVIQKCLTHSCTSGRLETEASFVTRSGSRISVRIVLNLISHEAATASAVLVSFHPLAEKTDDSWTVKAVLEYIPEGIAIADAPDVVVRAVSRYGLEMTAKDEANIIGISLRDNSDAFEIFDAEGARRLTPDELPIVRAIRYGEVVRNEIVSLRNAEGDFVPILCNAGPIVNTTDEIIGGVIAWRDVSELQKEEKRRILLLNEMHHRVKNAFALSSSLVSIVLRECTDANDMAEQLKKRIIALSRAQSLVSFDPNAAAGSGPVPLHALVDTVVMPFFPDYGDFIGINGPEIEIAGKSVPKLALMLTELITNAIKHGALSLPTGRVSVTWSELNDYLCIEWAETASGLKLSIPKNDGFGSRLLRGTVSDLRGEMTLDWRHDGLRARFVIPQEAVMP